MTTRHDPLLGKRRSHGRRVTAGDSARPARRLTAGDVMDATPLQVGGECPLDDLAARFARSGAEVAVVTDADGCPVGLVTPEDVHRLMGLHQRADLAPPRAGNAASLGAFTARLGTPLEVLIELLVDLGAAHVVVVCERGRLRGLISGAAFWDGKRPGA